MIFAKILRNRYKNGLLFFSLLMVFSLAVPADVEMKEVLGLYVSKEGMLMQNGAPYRGIGVNYFDAFYRVLLDPQDKSYKEGFAYLKSRKIPFIRFMAGGFWPVEYRLYLHDREKYFSLLDEFVHAAEEQGIGLIPSLFWNTSTISDLTGEPRSEWGNPDSRTVAFMRAYTEEIVARYKDSPAIWGWEFGNEMNAYADLRDQAKHFLPAVSREGGTPASRTAADAITSAHLRAALEEFGAAVRKHDKTRIIISGNDIPPPNAENRYRHADWKRDTRSGYIDMLRTQNPDPVDTLSIHLYPQRAFSYYADGRASLRDIIRVSMKGAAQIGKPLFIGEFGAPESLGPKQARLRFTELLNGIEASEVPLAALWVFDFPGQDKEWNVAPDNGRGYQLEQIAKLNERIWNEPRIRKR